jgi:Kef-type K+ transport system membrane component KefB
VPYLNIRSQLGLILFMFLVGLSVNPSHVKDHGHAAVLTSHVSMVAPFVLGTALATRLYPGFAGGDVSFRVFALFMGAAMSTTAFPVLARILREHRLTDRRAGTLAIACAAVDDVTGWCVLAWLTILVRGAKSPAWLTSAGAVVFVAIMIWVVKPLVRRFETPIFGNRGLDAAARYSPFCSCSDRRSRLKCSASTCCSGVSLPV